VSAEGRWAGALFAAGPTTDPAARPFAIDPRKPAFWTRSSRSGARLEGFVNVRWLVPFRRLAEAFRPSLYPFSLTAKPSFGISSPIY
jgi:hypothetical protein